jgi:hypothetical protein
MARWTVGPDENLVIEATTGGPISIDIPAGDPVTLGTEQAQDVRAKLALAITVAHGDTAS